MNFENEGEGAVLGCLKTKDEDAKFKMVSGEKTSERGKRTWCLRAPKYGCHSYRHGGGLLKEKASEVTRPRVTADSGQNEKTGRRGNKVR